MSLFQRLKEFFLTHIRAHMTSKAAVIAVTVLCVLSLSVQYFRQDTALAPATILGAIIVPFQQGINDIGGFLFNSEQEKLTLDEARSRLDSLQNDYDALMREREELQSIRIENQELRSLLSMKKRLGNYASEAAEIIGNDGTNVFERFTINKGSADGVKVNMNVVSKDGLVGYVSQVGLNYAVVTTIVEDGVRVSAMTRNGGRTCIVTGSLENKGKNVLHLDNALSSIDFTLDGMLVTSDISDRFLSGIPIGYVQGTTMSADGLTQSGTVLTSVDFTNLHAVLILTDLKEGKEDSKS